MSETELFALCEDYFSGKCAERSIVPLQKYFSRVITSNQTIELTSRLKSFIPQLAKEQDGVLCPMLAAAISGLSPRDYVPELKLQSSSKNRRNPRSGRIFTFARPMPKAPPLPKQSKANVENLKTNVKNAPLSSRPIPDAQSLISSRAIKKPGVLSFKTVLPPLKQTETDVLSALYVAPNNDFYIGKRVDPKSLDWHIVPPTYPEHMIGSEFNVIANGGVVTIKEKANGNVQDLHKFIEDKENEFIVENQMINKRASYRSFYHWRQRLREKVFSKEIHVYDQHFAVSMPNFAKSVEQIRHDVLIASEGAIVFPPKFDLKNEEADFIEMKQIADAAIYDVDRKMDSLKDHVGAQISETIRVTRAANVLIQLDFQELNSLNQLPPSLRQFANDLKWRVPSLWRERLREAQLTCERKLAHDRQDFISTFFSKVRVLYNGILVLKCKDMMLGFVDRFLVEPVNHRRPHRIAGFFDEQKGLVISPNREEFIHWFDKILTTTKAAFFQNLDKIWQEIIFEVDPNYEYTIENPFVVLSRFTELTDKTQEALDAINAAYKYFENEIEHHKVFVLNLVSKVDSSARFTDLLNIDKLQILLNELIKAKEELDKRPNNLFHRPSNAKESAIDFVVALAPAFDEIKKYYDRGMESLKLRVLNELNLLFTEINELWSAVKEKKILRTDARTLEAKTLQYSLLCDVFCNAWKESITEVKVSFDTVMKMYKQLSDKCKYTHASAARHFNKIADTLGLGGVPISNEMEEEEEE